MPRLSVPLTPEQHKAVKVKAAETGLPQAEVARRLLLAWLGEFIDLPGEEIEVSHFGGFEVWNHCSFCGEQMPSHADDCIYVIAKESVEGAGGNHL